MSFTIRTGRRSRVQGFTLIELMITISIIGILAAIFIPNMVRARFKAYHSGCLQGMEGIRTALESYRVDNHQYPTTLVLLSSGRYINSVPMCPSAPGTQYGYDLTSDGAGYTVYCAGYHNPQLGVVRAGYPQVVNTQITPQ